MKKIVAVAAIALALGAAACANPIEKVQAVRVTFAFFAYDESAQRIADMPIAARFRTPDEEWTEQLYAPGSVVLHTLDHPSIVKGVVVTAAGVGNAATSLECLWNAQKIYSYNPTYERSIVSANPEDKRFGPNPTVQCTFDPIRLGFLKEKS